MELDRFDWSTANADDAIDTPGEMAEAERIGLLQKYKELLDAGVITQEEFERKKFELLG